MRRFFDTVEYLIHSGRHIAKCLTKEISQILRLVLEQPDSTAEDVLDALPRSVPVTGKYADQKVQQSAQYLQNTFHVVNDILHHQLDNCPDLPQHRHNDRCYVCNPPFNKRFSILFPQNRNQFHCFPEKLQQLVCHRLQMVVYQF